ncbi:hypothetical protein LUZ60_000300 [Juncus effusus]|nr:hypothetical protein LUZ60_000300 [Juncus effusus]
MEKDSQPGPPEEHASPEALAAADGFFAQRRCCCFWIPWSTPNTSSWERIQLGDPDPTRRSPSSPARTRWWSGGTRALMKLREWSELVAGPRWKTFIRRFNRNGRSSAPNAGRFGSTRFQYDPLSYALNFDEGHGAASPEGDYTGYRDFSTRFVVPPASAKSSMDLGGRDAAPLFTAPARVDDVA